MPKACHNVMWRLSSTTAFVVLGQWLITLSRCIKHCTAVIVARQGPITIPRDCKRVLGTCYSARPKCVHSQSLGIAIMIFSRFFDNQHQCVTVMTSQMPKEYSDVNPPESLTITIIAWRRGLCHAIVLRQWRNTPRKACNNVFILSLRPAQKLC